MTYAIRPEPPKETPVTLVLTLTPDEARRLAGHWGSGRAWLQMGEDGHTIGYSLYAALLAAANS